MRYFSVASLAHSRFRCESLPVATGASMGSHQLLRPTLVHGSAAPGAVRCLGMHRDQRASLPDRSFGSSLYFLECTYFELSNALARHFELDREVFQCPWFVGETTRFEDAQLAIVEDADSADERCAPLIHLVILDHDGFRRRALIDELLQPFARVFLVTDRGI